MILVMVVQGWPCCVKYHGQPYIVQPINFSNYLTSIVGQAYFVTIDNRAAHRDNLV